MDNSIVEKRQQITNQYNDLEKKIESLKSAISLLQKLESTDRLTPAKRQILDNALFSYNSSVSLLETHKQELDEINDLIETRGYGRIVCTGTIYPATRISIGSSKLIVSEMIINASLYYSKGVINRGSIF